jgi:hypothetical protein
LPLYDRALLTGGSTDGQPPPNFLDLLGLRRVAG